MLPGQIGPDDLRAGVHGGQVDMYALPAVIPFRVGEEALQHFGVEIALARKVFVETAMGEAGAAHDLLDRYAIESEAVEQLSGALDDSGPGFRAVIRGVGQCFLRPVAAPSGFKSERHGNDVA
jgi:hypothetical protein